MSLNLELITHCYNYVFLPFYPHFLLPSPYTAIQKARCALVLVCIYVLSAFCFHIRLICIMKIRSAITSVRDHLPHPWQLPKWVQWLLILSAKLYGGHCQAYWRRKLRHRKVYIWCGTGSHPDCSGSPWSSAVCFCPWALCLHCCSRICSTVGILSWAPRSPLLLSAEPSVSQCPLPRSLMEPCLWGAW